MEAGFTANEDSQWKMHPVPANKKKKKRLSLEDSGILRAVKLVGTSTFGFDRVTLHTTEPFSNGSVTTTSVRYD